MPHPRFPLYIPSKSRAKTALTPKALKKMGIEHTIVIEENQFDDYAKTFGENRLLVLDRAYQKTYDTFDDLGDKKSKGPGPARNFIWEHSISQGHEWHWVMDDNIELFARLHNNQRIPLGDGTGFHAMEEFCLRYKNIGMAGPQYWMFAPSRVKMPPFIIGTRIYSCNLIRNDVPFRWRGRYNEDTDLSLRMLKSGWATIQFNAFLQYKVETQKLGGGNTEAFYSSEGTFPKSQMLVRMHPDVAKLSWKFGREHHHVNYNHWRSMPLIRDPDYVPSDSKKYSMSLRGRTKPEVIASVDTATKRKEFKGPSDLAENDCKDTYWKIVDGLDRSSNDLTLRHPIYIPSRGRAKIATTPARLSKENIDFTLVVEQEDAESYAEAFPKARILVLEKSHQGIAYARNACKRDAEKLGASWHWQLDDDIRSMKFQKDKKEETASFRAALHAVEAWTSQYINIGGVGPRTIAFSRTEKRDVAINRCIYTAMLLKCGNDHWFRDGVIEDIDYSLQICEAGECTVLLNRIVFTVPTTGSESGGNTEVSHQEDQRESRAKGTQKFWPGVFKLKKTRNGIMLAPSRIWKTFEQRPIPKK